MNHVLIVVANMKWNCNIVKEMYDRVLRRKFGMLCSDDTSNENFIKSYLNRLDCTPIDLSCLKGSNLPCTSSEASSTVVCNIVVNVVVTIVNNNFVFTATVTNAVLPVSYSWTYDTSVFQLVSNVGNVLTLEPILLFSGSVGGNVEVVVTDIDKCTGSWDDKINYRGGCTDPEAVNYDSLATVDNGTCYYDPLLISSAYECQEDDTGTLCIQASGGTPPYTVVGVPNGTILLDGGTLCTNLPNSTTFSFYVIDSLGAVSLIQRGSIDCPFDCETVTILSNFEVECLTDGLGNNTGEALLTVTPSGGNTPYSVTGSINGSPYGNFTQITPGVFSPGQSVNNGDVIDVIITDSNGCTTTDSITIDCPPPSPGGGTGFTCEQLEELNIQVSMLIVDVNTAGLFTDFKYVLTYQFTNLASFGLTIANIASMQYIVTPTVNPGFVSHFLTSTPGSPCLVCTGSLIPVVNPGTVPQYVDPNPYALANTQFVARYLGGCVGTETIESTLKLQITVVTDDAVCVLCFEKLLDADWICATETNVSTGVIMNNVTC
jgi:hypothetical protein